MARTVNEVKLTLFMLASDYDPAHYNWTKSELAALGDCKSTAEVIKKRLEDNGAKVKEMYAIEHEDEEKAESKSKECHNSTNTVKPKYHILVKFEPSHGAPLKEIAKYIGVPPEVIEKSKQGRYSYDDMLAYLTHIKDESKIPYAPEDVVTLAGSNYMDYYNERKERWINARETVAKKGGKTLDRLFREAVSKLESGELRYGDLAGIPEYRKLIFNPKYMKLLKRKDECVREVAKQDYERLKNKIINGEITALREIISSDEWKLACIYHQREIETDLQTQKEALINQNYQHLCDNIKNGKITSLAEITANKHWLLAYNCHKKDIEDKLVEQNIPVLLNMIKKKEITSLADIRANEDWKLVYEHCNKNRTDIENELANQNRDVLVDMIKARKITSLREIYENEDWDLIYRKYYYEIDAWLGLHK